jgi:hypothetical protein
MAGQQNTSSVGSHEFNKNLNKDLGNIFVPPAVWGHARNAINNSKTGDLGKLGNEPANNLCVEIPYQVIGMVHLVADTWTTFSTNGVQSEIGLFYADTCKYFTAVNDNCLKFSPYNLIKGASRATANCVYEIYWDDGLNNSRYITLNIEDPAVINPFTNPDSPIPWVQILNPLNIPPCQDMINTPALDCNKLRVAKLINAPCINVIKGASGGTLLNGSYFVCIAYAISGQKVSDYYCSNIQSLFQHENTASSLDVDILSMDTRYNEIIVVLVSIVNQQTVARQAGIYSTHQTRLSFDIIMDTWPAIPIEQIPIMTPIPDKSDAMYNVGPYLIRVGPTSKEDFNYQPLANQIVTKWVSVEYPADYYRKGGNHTNYLRDEVYPFSVRWVYDTGDKSAAYHIPGRPKLLTPIPIPSVGGSVLDGGTTVGNDDLESADGLTPFNWIVYNTATAVPIAPGPLPDGGFPIAEGFMGYWESSEAYPDSNPEVWNPSDPLHPWTLATPIPYSNTLVGDYDLCGKKIRHHRFPEDSVHPNAVRFTNSSPNFNNQPAIRVMGVKFENVRPPVDNKGVLIPGIVGYEILRGTRNGNKSVVAKGMINNMGQYTIEGGVTSRQGAYPNYPYNDLHADPFLSTGVGGTRWSGCALLGGGGGEQNFSPQSSFYRDKFTFHSPDTNFTDPYLSTKELKIYGEINGDVTGKFEYSEKHPKEKLLTNFAFTISAIVGLGVAALAMNGKRTVNRIPPKNRGYSQNGFTYSNTSGTWLPYGAGTQTTIGTPMIAPNNGAQPKTTDAANLAGWNTAITSGAITTVYETPYSLGALNVASNLLGGSGDVTSALLQTAYGTSNGFTGNVVQKTEKTYNFQDGASKETPGFARAVAGLPLYLNYFTQGTDTTMRLIKSISRYKDFALKYNSHCYYSRTVNPRAGNTRRKIKNEQYLGPQLTDLGTAVRVNNLYRARTVAIETTVIVTDPTVSDRTRFRATEVNSLGETPPPNRDPNMAVPGLYLKDPTKFEISTTSFAPGNPAGYQIASSHYVALKQRIRNQYGQLTNIINVPVSTCVIPSNGLLRTKTGILFGGDTYVGRYTEKNAFFYFYEWLYNQPDGFGLDYKAHRMLPHPRYWANFNEFETGDFTSSFMDAVTSLNFTAGSIILPSTFYNLDGLTCPPGFNPFTILKSSFTINDSWFYLFNSGIRDFFVESEINIDLRDWGNNDSEVYYDPYRYTDYKAMLETSIIKAGNYYKYDPSLSVSKLFTNYVSWAQMQSREYSPFLAETCFVYRPRRVIYSLPAQFEGRRDNWLIFLANNYYDFLNRVTCMKPVNKNGAIIFFDSASPVQFQGTDQLQTGLGTKLTIGDGGLFSQPLQSLTNADSPYEYASCQDRLSVINTPVGIFWMSQNQGKIFHLGNGPDPISDKDLKWWFNEYLPYKLTQLFPNFSLTDNPVIGIGCQAVYDNENGLAYFCKKDYVLAQGQTPSLKPGDGGTIRYDGNDNFTYIPTGLKIKLGDPAYFEDASWTVSYDPKTGGWLGWHDWHPELIIPGKNTFMSIVTNPVSKKGGIWRHNERCDLYCNYYGKDYPFEIEYMVNTPQQITTLRSIEYFMEVYKYDKNCYDRFHVLDYNFDDAVIYNTEQCSGLLRMTPNPRQDPKLMLSYPIINPTFIEILFSKVENKYRFNQFWDITDDRGEYPAYPLPPVAQRMIWNTGAAGYIKVLNAVNLNYNKPEFQRKKFRHYTNSVFLRKRVIVGQQMTYKVLIMITENKQLNSPR